MISLRIPAVCALPHGALRRSLSAIEVDVRRALAAVIKIPAASTDGLPVERRAKRVVGALRTPTCLEWQDANSWAAVTPSGHAARGCSSIASANCRRSAIALP